MLRDELSRSNTSDKANQIKNIDNVAQIVMDKFNSRDLGIYNTTHLKGTNTIYLDLSDKKNLSEIIKQIQDTKEIDYFIFWSNMIQEVNDSLSEHDYFKAFVLACTVFEFLAKEVLINYFNKKEFSIGEKKIRKLGLQSVIFILYAHMLIDYTTYSEIISLNKLRVKFVHYHLSQLVRKEDFREIDQSAPKIKSIMDKLTKLATESVFDKGERGLVSGRIYNGIGD